MKQILIVGGTGMLRGVTTHFIDKGHIVSFLARNRKRLKSFKNEYPIKKMSSYSYIISKKSVSVLGKFHSESHGNESGRVANIISKAIPENFFQLQAYGIFILMTYKSGNF